MSMPCGFCRCLKKRNKTCAMNFYQSILFACARAGACIIKYIGNNIQSIQLSLKNEWISSFFAEPFGSKNIGVHSAVLLFGLYGIFPRLIDPDLLHGIPGSSLPLHGPSAVSAGSTGFFTHVNTSAVDCADDGRFSGFDSVQNKPRKAVYPVVVILAKRFCCAYKEAQKLERETGTDSPVKQI